MTKLLAGLLLISTAALARDSALLGPYDAVNPFIGTAADGNTFPGASVPLGMMQWGPDTRADGWYHHADKTIRGFSLTHISGAGCPIYADVPILPWTGEVTSPGSSPDYALAFSHNREQAHPGSYAMDFDNGVIFVHESLAKSQRSRHIPLSNAVRQALKEVEHTPGSDYIFLNSKTDKPYGSFKRSFHTALRRAKISDFRFHDLRHTFASQLVRCGVDLYVVQKLLGHSTPKMTQSYAHLREDQLKEAIDKIDIQSEDLLYNSKFKKSTFSAHRAFDEIKQLEGISETVAVK